MILRNELVLMKTKYARKPMQDIKLKRPEWLKNNDPLSEIFDFKQSLVQRGTVTFAHIVQANSISSR